MNFKEIYHESLNDLKIDDEIADKLLKNEDIYGSDSRKTRHMILAKCAGVILVFSISAFACSQYVKSNIEYVNLKHSAGNITVCYTNNPKANSNSASYAVDVNEKQIFANSQAIIFGQLTGYKFLDINLNGNNIYMNEASIHVIKSFKGDISPNTDISILTPLFGDNIKEDDATVLSNFSTGNEAFLFINKYGDDDIIQSGDGKLLLKDLSSYGLPDGDHYVIVNKNNKYIYDHHSFSSLKGSTYNDIVNLIQSHLQPGSVGQ